MDPPALPRSLGEFRIEAVLGEGGSGIVYDATWGPRRVALKVLHAHLADSERVRAQFLVEAQRLQTITHPTVVKVLAVGELPDKRPYLAMERLEGETLAQVLAKGPLELTKALELFGELCAAVGTLHEQGLIHRDLKPENVFIVNGKHSVLLDFGIAKELDAPASTTTMDGGVRGTPAYMAPERFFGQPASVATDLYELAVTLYAMLAGRLPWDDLADPEARLSPRPLVELAPVPEELDVEIRRALSTRAQNRPASAAALDAAVRAAAGGSAPLQPSETARMRPAGTEPRPNATITAERSSKAWFAERHNTTDRGKTPLAWAPTAQQAPAPPPVSKSSRRWIAAAAVVAVLGGGIAVWKLRGGEPDAPAPVAASQTTPPVVGPSATLSAKEDPWGSPPPKPEQAASVISPLPVTGPEVSVAIAQAEIARAIPHLPSDTSFLAAALVGQLKRDQRFDAWFEKLANHPTVKPMITILPPCVRTLLAGSEWFVFGSVGFEANKYGTLIVRGRWARRDVEACFPQKQELTMTDGKPILQLPEVGWLDFIDDNTVYISVRQDLAAAQVHDSVMKGAGLTKRTKALLATLSPDRAFTFVADGSGDVEWPGDPLPRGSDMAAMMQVSESTVAFHIAMHVKGEAAAKELATKIETEIKPFAGTSEAAGQVKVTRTGTKVVLEAKLSTLMMGIVSSSLSSL